MEQTHEPVVHEGPEAAIIARNCLQLLRRLWWLVLLAAVLGGGLLGLRSHRSYTPVYQAQAVLSVHAGYTASSDLVDYGSYYNSSATQQVINTFSSIIETDAMREMLCQKLGTDYIPGSIYPSVVASSNLFTLTVTAQQPQLAYDILQAVLESYPRLASIVIGTTTLELIDEPAVPTAPINANSWRGTALRGALYSGAAMLVVLCLLAQLRTTVCSAEDMKRFSSLCCLSHVPVTVVKRRRKGHGGQISLMSPTISPSYAESIRTLRTRLLRDEQRGSSILITSTSPGEGKSTLAANLAISLAQAGKRVILVDGDLRAQSLTVFFGLPAEASGLAAVLQSKNADPVACLQQTAQENLRVLTGASASNPAGILRQRRLHQVLSTLQRECDVVLLDTPPIGLLADAMSFARLADSAIYVVRRDYAPRGRVADGLQALADSGPRLLGYVLNRTPAAYGSYGYHKYGYGRKKQCRKQN